MSCNQYRYCYRIMTPQRTSVGEDDSGSLDEITSRF